MFPRNIFCLLDCEKFQHIIIDELKHCAREEIKTLRHKTWIDNSIKNLAAKNKINYQRYMQLETNENNKNLIN